MLIALSYVNQDVNNAPRRSDEILGSERLGNVAILLLLTNLRLEVGHASISPLPRGTKQTTFDQLRVYSEHAFPRSDSSFFQERLRPFAKVKMRGELPVTTQIG